MTLTLGMKAVVINVKENEFTDRDGKAVKSYKVAIEQNGEVASIPCTEEVYKDAKPLTENNLFVTYSESTFDGRVRQSLRVTGVAVAK